MELGPIPTDHPNTELAMPKRPQAVVKGPRTRRCKFNLDAPHATVVAVAGSFNEWAADARPLKRGTDGVWEATLLLPPGRYEYRFVVDGEWQDDPTCPERVPNGHGSENCVLIVPALATGKSGIPRDVDDCRAA